VYILKTVLFYCVHAFYLCLLGWQTEDWASSDF